MFLNSTADINTAMGLVNNQIANGNARISPEIFYSRQLLDTIKIDPNTHCVYYRLADEQPIQDKSDKLYIRRWAPLEPHTVPLAEGIPPKSDKGSVEKYEMQAYQYGRYMEFSDKVSFKVVDPIIAHYTKQYSEVAIETLDMLAKEVLFAIANPYYAGGKANLEGLDLNSKPNMTDLRLIVLSLKKNLVKPRSNGRFHVIASPEFFYDMISDPVVEKYMSINQTTKNLYDTMGVLVPMFDMEFYETYHCPSHGGFIKNSKKALRLVAAKTDGSGYVYKTIDEDTVVSGTTKVLKKVSGYVKDSRTGSDASYIPDREYWDLAAYNAVAGNLTTGAGAWSEFKIDRCLVVGKDALTRTGLSGEGQAQMFVKELGSSGVLDPINQRQSIGFKINSVGFGSTRIEATVCYHCVPTQTNLV